MRWNGALYACFGKEKKENKREEKNIKEMLLAA